MRYVWIVAVLLLIAVPSFGASSFLGGFSGNVLTPDAVITPQGTWEVSDHEFLDVIGGAGLNAFGLQYGLVPNLEVGASLINSHGSDLALNGKYRLLAETATRPAVVAGVFDVTGSVDALSSDPGFYAAISKNITRFATDVAGEPSKPLRLTLGLGSGVFNGFFAGLDWTLEPRFSLMAEFFGGRLGGDKNVFNAGGRFAITDALRVDAGTIDFKDFTFGASYRVRL